MGEDRSWWKPILLNVRALGAGVLVAVLLVGTQVWIDDFLNDAYMFVAPAEAARFAMSIAAIVSLQILLVCVPLWMVLSKFRIANWMSAAVLGFVATMAYWLIFGPADDLMHDRVRALAPFAVCGAGAGVATWLARPKPSLAR